MRRWTLVIAVLMIVTGGTIVALAVTRRAAIGAPPGPYDGTPAEGWARGEAGIATPAVQAVEGWTAPQVTDALAQVRKALVAARLDERMLVRHDPSAFLGLITPAQREGAKSLLPTVATRLDKTVSQTAEARVRGKTTFRGLRDPFGRPALELVTNHVWVYSLGGQPVVVHDEVRWTFYGGARVRSSDGGMWLTEAKAYAYRMDCAAHRNGLLAPQRTEASAAPADDSYYDPNRPIRAPSTC